ncbi:MAG: RloB family protein [Actinomycetes bacterium]|nr:RloB family protein [Actinomycetes bacterium]
MPKKQKQRFQRRPAYRESASRILVITEGTKTEPCYLNALLAYLQITPQRVVVQPSRGSDPITVVDTATEMVKSNKSARNPDYDAIWLVMDTECDRVHLPEALDKARAHQYNVAISAPCIEYWFILHFTYTTKYMETYAEVERELRKHYADYSKGNLDPRVLTERTETAMKNAKLVRQNQAGTNTDYPKTDVDLLVASIQSQSGSAGGEEICASSLSG